MASVLKLRRGTSSQNDSFTGANGEITYDVTNKTIRAHDGLTAGGVKLAKNSDVTTKMSVANTQALFATVSANNATINKKMSVANTQTLHTSVTANLNSYIANTNPRITNILSSITGTNTAIRTLVSDRMQTANTTLLVNDRMQVANVTSLLANKLNITDSGQGFSESTVFEFPTGNYDGSDSYIGQTTVDAFGVALSNIFSCMEPIGSTDAVDLGTL